MKSKLPPKAAIIKPLIGEFKQELINLYGSRLKQLILFGSYARGNPHAESDIDFLVLLDEIIDPYKEIDFVADMKFNFMLNHDVVISCIHADIHNFDNLTEPLYYNVKKEGIIV